MKSTAIPSAADTPAFRWPRAHIALHWVTALIVLAAFAMALWRNGIDERTLRAALLELHRHAGLLVLALALLRLALRGVRRAPPVQRPLAAHLVHGALYVLLVALPLLGWAAGSAAGRDPLLFGQALPALVAPDEDLADTLALWHARAAWTLAALVAAHVAAALWHHFRLRDGTLRAMWPLPARS